MSLSQGKQCCAAHMQGYATFMLCCAARMQCCADHMQCCAAHMQCLQTICNVVQPIAGESENKAYSAQLELGLS